MNTPNVPELHTDGISPKALVATLAALVLPLLIQVGATVVEWLAHNPAVFDGLPAWLRFAISTVLTALGVALAAYRARPGQMRVVARPGR